MRFGRNLDFTYNPDPKFSIDYEFNTEFVVNDNLRYEFDYIGFANLIGLIMNPMVLATIYNQHNAIINKTKNISINKNIKHKLLLDNLQLSSIDDFNAIEDKANMLGLLSIEKNIYKHNNLFYKKPITNEIYISNSSYYKQGISKKLEVNEADPYLLETTKYGNINVLLNSFNKDILRDSLTTNIKDSTYDINSFNVDIYNSKSFNLDQEWSSSEYNFVDAKLANEITVFKDDMYIFKYNNLIKLYLDEANDVNIKDISVDLINVLDTNIEDYKVEKHENKYAKIQEVIINKHEYNIVKLNQDIITDKIERKNIDLENYNIDLEENDFYIFQENIICKHKNDFYIFQEKPNKLMKYKTGIFDSRYNVNLEENDFYTYEDKKASKIDYDKSFNFSGKQPKSTNIEKNDFYEKGNMSSKLFGNEFYEKGDNPSRIFSNDFYKKGPKTTNLFVSDFGALERVINIDVNNIGSFNIFNTYQGLLSGLKIGKKDLREFGTISECSDYILNRDINVDHTKLHLTKLVQDKIAKNIKMVVSKLEEDFENVRYKHPSNEDNIDIMQISEVDFKYADVELQIVDENGVPTMPVYPPIGEWIPTYERLDWMPYRTNISNFNNMIFGQGMYIASYMAPNFGTTKLIKSTDAKVWEPLNTPLAPWNNVAYGNNTFIATAYGIDESIEGYNKVIRSTDGINWEEIDIGIGQYIINHMCYENNMFIGIARVPWGTTSKVVSSIDGLNWTITNIEDGPRCYSIAYGNGRFVSTHSPYPNNGITRISVDGISWETHYNNFPNQWTSTVYGNGIFMTTTNDQVNYSVMISSDGINWSGVKIPNVNIVADICFDGENFIIAPSIYDENINGSLYKSPDGITWEEITINNFETFYKTIEYVNNNYIATAYRPYQRMDMIISEEVYTGLKPPPLSDPAVRVHFPNVHYNKYFDIGLLQDPVNAYVLKDMIMILSYIRRTNLAEIESVNAYDAMNFILDKLLEYIDSISTVYLEDKIEEYKRVWRMIRWYGESAVLKNSEYWIIRDYSNTLMPIWYNDIEKIPYIKTNENFVCKNNCMINTKDDAIIEIEYESFIDSEINLIFKACGDEQFSIFLNEDELTYNLGELHNISLPTTPGTNRLRIETNRTRFKITKLEVGGDVFMDMTTEYRAKGINPGTKTIDELLRLLVRYFDIHHYAKTKRYREML
jgi:hypothetical protein